MEGFGRALGELSDGFSDGGGLSCGDDVVEHAWTSYHEFKHIHDVERSKSDGKPGDCMFLVTNWISLVIDCGI